MKLFVSLIISGQLNKRIFLPDQKDVLLYWVFTQYFKAI